MKTKERPILFSGPMVRAILENRKAQTRRIVKPQPKGQPPFAVRSDGVLCDKSGYGCSNHKRGLIECPYGKPGERLWVRETWAEVDDEYGTPLIVYRAGGQRLSILL